MAGGMQVYSHAIVQPEKSISSWDYDGDGIYSCVSAGAPCVCHAAELQTGGTGGNLRVHLVGDPDGTWYDMPMVAGSRNSAIFDKIDDGSTITASEITLFVLVK